MNAIRKPEFQRVDQRFDGLVEHRNALARRAIPTGISYVDDIALGLHPTDLLILSAATGAGKTTAGLFMAKEAAQASRVVHYFALEAFQGEMELRLLYQEMGVLVSQDRNWNPTLTFNRWMHGLCSEFSAYEQKAMQNLRSQLRSMHTLYRGANFTHRDVTKHFMAVRSDTDLIVLDHLHYIDGDGPNENNELKKIIKAIRDVTLDMEVPVVVVAHLRKKQGPRSSRGLPESDDVHGSSEVSKVATKIVMLSPCPSVSFGEGEYSKTVATTAIQVLKDRYAGATNYVGLVGYDLSRMAYRQTYAVARLSSSGGKLIHLSQNELPYWAKLRGVGLKEKLGEGTDLS